MRLAKRWEGDVNLRAKGSKNEGKENSLLVSLAIAAAYFLVTVIALKLAGVL